MKYHELNAESHKDKKRVGRGIAAGGGKTAGRGTKGQKARTGKKLRAGFEGGQLPLLQRIPKKRGFKSLRVPAQVVYTHQLNKLNVDKADNLSLFEAGLVSTPFHAIKIIAKGDIEKAVNVKVQSASKGAVEMIKTAGGSFEKQEAPRQEKQSKEEK